MKRYQHYINGEWLDASDEEIIPVLNPANEELIGEITCGKEADINHAVDAAKKAYNSRILVDMNPMERAKLMRRIAEELRKISKEGGALLCVENGKLLSSAINEFIEAANYFDYYSGLTDKIEGQTIPVNSQVMDYTVYEPYGVSGHIVPWNFPIAMIARSLACSFAAGNSTVIKPAELTPLATTSYFAQAIHNAEVPKGLINIVTGYGSEAGAALTAHPEVAQITFTGSVKTGKAILHAAAERAVPAVVELGGKSAAVVLPDADIDKVVNATTANFEIYTPVSPSAFISGYNGNTFKYKTTSPNATGPIKVATMTSGGFDYDILPGITGVTSAAGTNAILEPISDSVGTIQSVQAISSGYGYNPASDNKPKLRFPQISKISENFVVSGVSITDPGEGYIFTPRIVVSGGGLSTGDASHARLKPVIVNGKVLDLEITFEGIRYSSAPTLDIEKYYYTTVSYTHLTLPTIYSV